MLVTATCVAAVGLMPAAKADSNEREISSFEASVALVEDGSEKDSVRVTEHLTYGVGPGDDAPVERWLPRSGAVDDGPERDLALQDVEVMETDGLPYDIDEQDDATTGAWARRAETHSRTNARRPLGKRRRSRRRFSTWGRRGRRRWQLTRRESAIRVCGVRPVGPGLTTPATGNACDHHHPPCPSGQKGGQRS